MAVVFPSSDLDDPRALIALTGSFWAETYHGGDLVTDLLFARSQLDAQAQLDFLELLASISRFTVPVWHTDNWYHLTLRESEKIGAELARFDGTYTFSSGLLFDQPVTGQYHVWNVPETLSDVRVILNSITNSTVVLTQGVDYFLQDNKLWLRADPFEDARFPKVEEFADGAVTDRTCSLWLYRGRWDWETVYRQFGYVVAEKFQSSLAYRDYVNSIYDNMVGSTTQRAITRLFAALADVPVAGSTETVELVTTDARGLVVVTDKAAYRFKTNSVPVVAAGDIVRAGDPLVDTVQFFEFNRGQAPSVAELRAVTVGRGMLKEGYFADLVFENETVPLIVEPNVNGYTKVSFEIGGFPGDVERFWDSVHSEGVAAGETLAMLLDTRTNKVEQPTAMNLPATVNPLAFMTQNVLRNNAYAVVLKPQYFGPNALGLAAAKVLRKLVPPHTAYLIAIELVGGPDTVTMDGPGDTTRAGYSEAVTTFLGGSIEEQIHGPAFIGERVRAYTVNGRCI